MGDASPGPHPPLTLREWSWLHPSDEAIQRAAGQVLSVLQHLHAHGVAHGRLSWHTVLVDREGPGGWRWAMGGGWYRHPPRPTHVTVTEPALSAAAAVQRPLHLGLDRDVPPAPELRDTPPGSAPPLSAGTLSL